MIVIVRKLVLWLNTVMTDPGVVRRVVRCCHALVFRNWVSVLEIVILHY